MVTACGAQPVAHAMVNFSNTVEESTEFGPRIIMVNLNHYTDRSIAPYSVKKCLDDSSLGVHF
jgi:hypothetical protein